jgi:hypothetical protein
MDVTINVDLEKFRYSLVGDGYLLEEVVKMTREDLIAELTWRVNCRILGDYKENVRCGRVPAEVVNSIKGV